MKLLNKKYINVEEQLCKIEYIKVKGKDIPVINKGENPEKLIKIEKELRLFQLNNDIHEECLTSIANYLFRKDSIESDIDFNECFKEFNFEEIIEIHEIAAIKEIITERENPKGCTLIIKLPNKLPIVYLIPNNKCDINEIKINNTIKNNISILEKFDTPAKMNYVKAIKLLRDIKVEDSQYTLTEINALWYKLSDPILFHIESKEIVETDLWNDTKLSILYHENSKLRSFHQQGDFMKPVDEIDDIVKKFTLKGRKRFSNKTRIDLPKATKENTVTIEDVVLQRRSRRNYSDEKVQLQTLSNILYYSYGVTGRLKNTSLDLRAVPSGGGLYPVDIYLSVRNVEGLDVGIYYYDPLDHCLYFINNRDMSKLSNEVSGYSLMLDNAAFTVILSANFWRNQWKYHERGYRVILIDCGHLAQNIHMMSTAYGLGSCCLMGFVDDEVDRLLEIDGIVEHSMYLITVGHNEIKK